MLECPAGKVVCEHYRTNGIGDACYANEKFVPIKSYGMTDCPWPSKQNIVEGKFERAWKWFSHYAGRKIATQHIKDVFERALKEAGYDD